MTDPDLVKPGPIEVWLRRSGVGINCLIVHDDESTYEVQVESPSMLGAQREITGYFITQGYQPVGGWEMSELTLAEPAETYRTFKH
jgi:hypothetical protein